MYPIKVITVDKSRALENGANAGGLSFAAMMENAGRRTAEAIGSRMALEGKEVVVLVGPGNNGGDGLVAAHYLAAQGAFVTLYIWKRDLEGDANLKRVEADRLEVIWAEQDPGFGSLRPLISGADVVVDALLGVGVTRPLGGSLKELLDVVRQGLAGAKSQPGLVQPVAHCTGKTHPLAVAVDCPTGLDCDTGALDPAAIPADVTVTFAYPKVGHLRFPGAAAIGDLVVADIGLPADLVGDVRLELATADLVRNWLPGRPGSAHKGTFGSALIVAGSANYVGAASLAGAGAARVGAGLVTLAVPAPIQSAVAAQLAEATYLLLPHDLGVTAAGAVRVLEEQMDDYSALLLGPGLTQEPAAKEFVYALLGLEQAGRKGRIGFVASARTEPRPRPCLPPLVVDADGLNILGSSVEWWSALPPGTILTPHPGEMARLMGGETTAAEIQADREGAAQRMAVLWGAVVVLKGALTVIAGTDGRIVVLPFVNAGLATAGSGDVLAGAIVGLRAQGMEPFEAAVTGAYLHGLAGELARAELGDMGLVAGDLPRRLPLAIRCVRSSG